MLVVGINKSFGFFSLIYPLNNQDGRLKHALFLLQELGGEGLTRGWGEDKDKDKDKDTDTDKSKSKSKSTGKDKSHIYERSNYEYIYSRRIYFTKHCINNICHTVYCCSNFRVYMQGKKD